MDIGISPVAFTIGSLEVRWYGVLMMVGVMVLIGWTAWQIRRGARISYDALMGAALVGIPSGIVFARLLHVIDQWSYYSQNPGLIIGGQGLTIYGAILGAALGVWVYSRFVKINYAYMADIVTPGIILAQAIGRVGCTVNGCCYGKAIDDSVLNVVYINPASFGPLGEAVSPTQIFEIIFLLLLFVVVLLLRKRLKPIGATFLFYLGMYSLWRIGIGFLRVGTPFMFGLEQAQVIGIIVGAICFGLLIYRYRQYRAGKIPAEEAADLDKITLKEGEDAQA
jgi:phosphatidylglycerol---prolipoprotein diacylglyceryl transferase